MFNRFTKRYKVKTILSLILAGSLVFAEIPEKQKGQQSEEESINAYTSSRGQYNRFQKSSQQGEGNRIYFKTVFVDGNLITGQINNRGLLSNANGDLRGNYLSWPKGANQVPSIFACYFYTAGEVVDANGNTIGIVSDSYSFTDDGTNRVNTPAPHTAGWQPLPRYYNLDIPNALTEPLVLGISEDVGEDGEPNTGDFGEGDGILQAIEDFNGNGVLDLSLQNEINWFASTARKETWPQYWPPQSYEGDTRQEGENVPGVRAGRWNGENGAKLRADQETYYVMDDRENDQFEYFPFDDTRSWPEGRRGLGMEIEARTYQWNGRLAEDILINLYDITNNGKDLEKVVVGMMVDPDMGLNTNNDADAQTIDDITYTWNLDGRDLDTGLPTGYFGFAFLESPGLSFDGIDNDLDGLVDESQSNGIDDDNDWLGWIDLDGDGVFTNEDKNFNRQLDEGEDTNGNGVLDLDQINDDTGFDGLGPEELGYPGPDVGEADGLPTPNEPNFESTDNDESDQVGLTSVSFHAFTCCMANDQRYWQDRLQPNPDSLVSRDSDWQTDVAFTYGSGFVEFKERPDGNGGLAKETHSYAIALIFGNDFPDVLRNKRTMQIIYDNDYAFATPPSQSTLTTTAGDKEVYLRWDDISEKSFDPIYKRDFEAYYIYRSTTSSFDDIRTITDAFGNPLLFKPLAIFDLVNNLQGLHPISLGSELGSDSDLGTTYNLGSDSGIKRFYIDSLDIVNGRTYYYAISAIDRGHHPSFVALTGDSSLVGLASIAPTETPINIQVDLLGRAISFDRNTARVTPTELPAGWEPPSISEAGVTAVEGGGTGTISIETYNPLEMQNGARYQVLFEDDGRYESINPLYTGELSRVILRSIDRNGTVLTLDNPLNNSKSDNTIVDGFYFLLANDTTQIDSTQSGWTTGNSTLKLFDKTQSNFNRVKRNYEIRVLGANADSSIIRRPVNFQIWDVTDAGAETKMDFFIFDRGELQKLDNGDDIAILDISAGRKDFYRFEFRFPASLDSSEYVNPQEGDVYTIITRRAFDRNDILEFEIGGNAVNESLAKNELDDIYVVPDPYIAFNVDERLVINRDEGRGERKIEFVNLPEQCTIKIFTASGKLVRTLEHNATSDNRRRAWDLRTVDALEVAYGIYFYAVDAGKLGVKTGKFAIIK